MGGVDPSENTAALRRLGSVVLTVAAISVVTYLVPSFERVRPWVSGEGVPILRLYSSEREPAELPEFQGALAAEPSTAAAPPLPLPASVPMPAPVAAPARPLPNETSETAVQHPSGVAASTSATNTKQKTAAGGRKIDNEVFVPPLPAPHAARPAAGITIDPSEYEGMVVPIEYPEALSVFYAALRRSALRAPSAITRVAHYGDSSVAADEITHTARRMLQTRFGDAGHGFMLTAKGSMFYGHRDVTHRESDGWELQNIVRKQLSTGYYGYGGVVAVGKAGQFTLFGTNPQGPIGRSVSRFEVFYQRYEQGGPLQLIVDDKEEQSLDTRAPGPEDAWQVIEVADGSHVLTLRAQGDVRIYGVSQERNVPGVVYDSLGLVGARAERLLDAQPAHMAAQIKHRDPDLLVLGFGGNEAGDVLDPVRYARSLTQVIKLMHAGKPQMSCLLFGPLDQGTRNARGDVVTLPAVPGIVEIQRRVAGEQGCAFFDTYKGMGGEGAVGRWYRARPRLFSPDYRHATPAGYTIIAEMYYRAMLKGFADYLASHGQ